MNKVQRQTTSAIHANAKILVVSPTGSGKTEAALLPILTVLEHKEGQ